MKKVKLLLCALIGLFAFSTAQPITVINKGDCFKPPQDQMVVLDKYTFAKYHYTAAQCDTLKQEIKQLDSLIVRYDSTQTELVTTYQLALSNKEQQVNEYKESYGQLKSTVEDCINKQNQLQVDYNKIEQKNKRVKRWRNFFMGTSAILGTVIVLAVTH